MKLICIGRNYVKHIEELGNEIPENPVIFIKPESAVAKQQTIHFPKSLKSVHFEGEMILRICKTGHATSIEESPTFYDALSVGIDFTDRKHQDYLKSRGLPWETAKAFDNSAVIGKWIPKATLNSESISFKLLKNNNIVQSSSTEFMMYNFDRIVYEISKFFKLEEGDVIFTGTPHGVGLTQFEDVFEGYLESEKVFKVTIA